MNISLAIIFLIGGLVILWKSAELLVSGAVALARLLGVSPLVIGLTVVAMGTSAPEVAASIAAAARGVGDVAIGNVYGSNIANLALVGGLAALIRPIKVQLLTLKREIPAMILVAFLLWPILHDLYLSRPEGILLLAVFAALILFTVYSARKDAAAEPEPPLTGHRSRAPGHGLLFVVIGLIGLALGADITIRGAVFIGQRIGLSNAVIGLTIIAVGTSLPELATCIAAAVKAQHDISVGTLVGSNIFNALLALGVAGIIRPFDVVGRLIGVDYLIMVLVSLLFAAAAVIGRRTIKRPSGALLLTAYLMYITYLLAFNR